MILYPAIDLKAGACVRLVRGEMASATVFNDDPTAQACDFAKIGFAWLHVVDLDGAFAGRSVNGEAVRAIREAVPGTRIQLGGGIRDRDAIDMWIALGIERVVLGTAALSDPQLVREASIAYPESIAVAIDARDGRVAVQGWSETSKMGVIELAQRFADSGVASLIYTDINRDGALSGVDTLRIRDLARAIDIPVIASGGVASIQDISALMRYEEDGIVGAIIGRAFYDGSIDPKDALRRVNGSTRC